MWYIEVKLQMLLYFVQVVKLADSEFVTDVCIYILFKTIYAATKLQNALESPRFYKLANKLINGQSFFPFFYSTLQVLLCYLRLH